jgi:hypothetical protein
MVPSSPNCIASWSESRNRVTVSAELTPTDLAGRWFPRYLNSPADPPMLEVDVRIHSQSEDAYAAERVWWQMRRHVLRAHTSFVYEPRIDNPRYFATQGLPWAWSFVEAWPECDGPLMVIRTDEEFFARCEVLSEDDWQGLLCSVLHAWNSTVLLHAGPTGPTLDGDLKPLCPVIKSEHEWDGGRFYFLSDELLSPIERVRSLFRDALNAARI